MKKQQVILLSTASRVFLWTLTQDSTKLRELAMMNGTFKEHPSERAARIHSGRGAGAAASSYGGQSSSDWATGGSAYADPSVVAYNRVRRRFPLSPRMRETFRACCGFLSVSPQQTEA